MAVRLSISMRTDSFLFGAVFVLEVVDHVEQDLLIHSVLLQNVGKETSIDNGLEQGQCAHELLVALKCVVVMETSMELMDERECQMERYRASWTSKSNGCHVPSRFLASK